MWRSWETTGVNVSMDLSGNKKVTNTTFRKGTDKEFRELWKGSPGTIDRIIRRNGGVVPGGFRVEEETTKTNLSISGSVGVELNQRRTGTQQTITESIDTESLGDRVVSREVIQFMRSRNITFTELL